MAFYAGDSHITGLVVLAPRQDGTAARLFKGHHREAIDESGGVWFSGNRGVAAIRLVPSHDLTMGDASAPFLLRAKVADIRGAPAAAVSDNVDALKSCAVLRIAVEAADERVLPARSGFL